MVAPHVNYSLVPTHPSTLSTRLDRLQVPLFKFSVRPDRESSPVSQLWWCVLNQVII